MPLHASLQYINAKEKPITSIMDCGSFYSLRFDAGSFSGDKEVSILVNREHLVEIRDVIDNFLKIAKCDACKKDFVAGSEGTVIVGGYRFCSSECEHSYDHVLND